MQKVLPVPGGLEAYLGSPEIPVTEESRTCPFCGTRHRLRLHGHDHRIVLVAGGQAVRLPVRRLLCVVTGRTVSLLPAFCLPRRQHGTRIVGRFLAGYASGASLRSALVSVRPDAPGHSVAQSLRNGFLARAGPIRAHLARRHARALAPPPTLTGRRREVAALLAWLCQGLVEVADAFVRHGAELHAAFQIGLA